MCDYFNQWASNWIQKVPEKQQIGIIQETPLINFEIPSKNIHFLDFKNQQTIWKQQTYDVLLIQPNIVSNQTKSDLLHQFYNHLRSGGRLLILSIIDSQQEDTSYFWDSQFQRDPKYLKFIQENKNFILNIEDPILNLIFLEKYFQINYQTLFSTERPHQFIITMEGIKKDNIIVQSLWIGPSLSNLEKLSISSFIKNGHDFHLYTYEPVEGIPPGTTLKDGNDILSEKEIFSYSNTNAGKSSVSAFSNLFRFMLLYLKGNYWVDTDMVCTQFLNMSEPYLFTTEPHIKSGYKKETINAGIIKLPIFSPEAEFGINRCHQNKEKILSGEIKWGLGPKTTQIIVSQFKLEEFVKPWYFSNSCACHHWKSLLETLNWKFYLKKYPDLKKKIKTQSQAINHWKKHGQAEGLMGLPYQHLIIRNFKEKPSGNYTIHLWNQFWSRHQIDKNSTYDFDCLFEQLKRTYL